MPIAYCIRDCSIISNCSSNIRNSNSISKYLILEYKVFGINNRLSSNKSSSNINSSNFSNSNISSYNNSSNNSIKDSSNINSKTAATTTAKTAATSTAIAANPNVLGMTPSARMTFSARMAQRN